MDSINEGIAVIGLAGRFPGAKNIDEFWINLINGTESITHFTDEELAKNEIYNESILNDPNYVGARGIIEDIDKFDAEFFGYNPMDARTMDPQHRVWLETAWSALENAGCDPYKYKGAIGVFVGSLYNTYLWNNIIRNKESLEKFLRLYDVDSFQMMINNDGGFLPTKTAYKFNLKGPAINVQTACSTSLVAIAQACQSLYSYESDTCIAGGVSIIVPQESGYLYQNGAITSADGHCRPFDAKSNGTVSSNGVGAVVLKRLEDAINDNDHIYAIIKGWGINNDGSNKVSYMAPSVDGQAEAILMAQAIADVNPRDISYIETHGTATPLGDPIEIAALTKAFSQNTNEKQFCAIGSVKSNIGHLDTAAGVAGFIKTALSAYHRQIPPTVHFTSSNPNIDFAKTPFYVVNDLKTYTNEKPLIMGVSSFGIGGTNAHIILQEPIKRSSTNNSNERHQLFLLSAKSENALKRRKEDLLQFCKSNPASNIADIAYTLQVGRSSMPYKSFGVFDNKETLLTEAHEDHFFDSYCKNDSRSVAFMFPGQGAQYINMGKNLYETEPFCKNIFDNCFNIFENETGKSLKTILFQSYSDESSELNLSRTEYTQPSLFIVEYVAAKYLELFGILPEVLIGHSIGEYAAACLSGVFQLEDALKIVIKRGQLMQKIPGGHMMVAKCDEETLLKIKADAFEIAAVNAPNYCTISFPTNNSELVSEILQANSIDCIPLNTSHAFHSSAFDPILEEFANYINQFEINSPQIPFISCLTGNFIRPEDTTSGKYWADQLRNGVKFYNGITTILETGDYVLLEVGPNTHLTSLAKRCHEKDNKPSIFTTLGKPEEKNEQYKMMITLGHLWAKGINIDFEQLHHPSKPKKIVLPSYPFERKRHWVDKTEFIAPAQSTDFDQITASRNNQLNDNNEAESEKTLIGNKTIDILKQMLCDLSGIDPIEAKPTISFAYMGLESLFLAQFAQAIEKKFKVNIKFRQLIQEYQNLELVSKYIDKNSIPIINEQENLDSKSLKFNGNLVILKPEGISTPFTMVFGDICNTYLPRRINKNHPYWGFMHSGSDGEKIEFKTIEEMAKSYVEELLVYKPHGPYLLGGYSFGGIVAFEMAIQLRNRGFEVPFLLAIDSLNPLKKKHRISIEGMQYILKTAYKKTIYRLTMNSRKSIGIDFRNAYIMGVYEKLWKKYKPSKFNGVLTLVKSSGNRSKFKNLGWDEHTDKIELLELKGNHMEIIRTEENINILVDYINEKLKATQAKLN